MREEMKNTLWRKTRTMPGPACGTERNNTGSHIPAEHRRCTIYITHQPCLICAKMIINAGIRRIVVREGYPDEMATEMLARQD
jgi:deoxycytidylate deaminase